MLLLAQHARLGADSPARLLPADAAKLIAALLAPRQRRSCVHSSCARRSVIKCACKAAAMPCFSDCPQACRDRNLRSSLRTRSSATDKVTDMPLSDCARDHRSVIMSLSASQFSARYPLACEERWGGSKWGGGEHKSKRGLSSVPLVRVLSTTDDACERCGGDGDQFFSFCLNRPVNADRVTHCLSCGRCFYFH